MEITFATSVKDEFTRSAQIKKIEINSVKLRFLNYYHLHVQDLSELIWRGHPNYIKNAKRKSELKYNLAPFKSCCFRVFPMCCDIYIDLKKEKESIEFLQAICQANKEAKEILDNFLNNKIWEKIKNIPIKLKKKENMEKLKLQTENLISLCKTLDLDKEELTEYIIENPTHRFIKYIKP
jgi:ribosomal protein L31E